MNLEDIHNFFHNKFVLCVSFQLQDCVMSLFLKRKWYLLTQPQETPPFWFPFPQGILQILRRVHWS